MPDTNGCAVHVCATTTCSTAVEKPPASVATSRRLYAPATSGVKLLAVPESDESVAELPTGRPMIDQVVWIAPPATQEEVSVAGTAESDTAVPTAVELGLATMPVRFGPQIPVGTCTVNGADDSPVESVTTTVKTYVPPRPA